MRRASMLAVFVLMCACGNSESAHSPELTHSQSSVSSTITEPTPPDIAPLWATLGPVAHALPGPAAGSRSFDPARARLDQRCRSCHAAHAREHAGSQHATAWSSRAFQQAFAGEPRPFCQSCHAPETSPREAVPEAAAELGIACVTCHVEPGSEVVWAAGEARRSEAAPHPLARSPAFAGPQACAGCHEFGFPDNLLRDEPLAMQSTVSEHAASRWRWASCADCHMPTLGSGRRSHAFVGAYDRDMLARSLNVTSERIDATRVRVNLRPGVVGHAVPTGDLLRRLEVALLEIDAHGRERVLDRRWLGREFASRPQPGGLTVRDEIRDTRVGEHGREVILRVPADAGSELVWRVLHQRVAHAGRDPRQVAIEGQLELARGRVP